MSGDAQVVVVKWALDTAPTLEPSLKNPGYTLCKFMAPEVGRKLCEGLSYDFPPVKQSNWERRDFEEFEWSPLRDDAKWEPESGPKPMCYRWISKDNRHDDALSAVFPMGKQVTGSNWERH